VKLSRIHGFLRMVHDMNHEKNPSIARVAGNGLRGLRAGYPSHPVRFVVPFPPGSLPDQIARVIGPQLQDSLASVS